MLAPCTLTPEHAGNITIQKIYSYISNDICNSRIIKYFRTFFFCCNFLLLSDRLVIQDYFFGLTGFLTSRFFDIANLYVIIFISFSIALRCYNVECIFQKCRAILRTPFVTLHITFSISQYLFLCYFLLFFIILSLSVSDK